MFAAFLACLVAFAPVPLPKHPPALPLGGDRWTAYAHRMPPIPPDAKRLFVKGEITLPKSQKARLFIAKPQGINSKILILNLVFEPSPEPEEKGNHKVEVKESYADKYTHVTIRYPRGTGKAQRTIKIEAVN